MVTPAQFLGESEFSFYQLRAIIICFLIAALDGFDTQSIAFVAPALRHLWEIAPEQFGPLFAAGLIGTMIGAVILSSLADRFGRKPLIIFSTLLFGTMSLLCSTATSVDSLFMYRLIAGFGLGGAIPNILALVSEYAPHRIRSTVIVATFTGFPFGAVVGGIASSKIIPASGWEMVFIIGGILPLALLPFVFAWVPESLRYLLRRDGQQEKAKNILERIKPGCTSAQTMDYTTSDAHTIKPVRNLFAANRVVWTILLWLLTFTTLLLGYFLINWTPLLLVDAGVPHQKAILGVVALNLGGIIGSLILGRLSDKRGPFKVVATAFGIGAIAVAVLGLLIGSSVPVLLSIVLVIGLFVFGAQLNVTALAANYYPLDMRSTGIGWSMGFGRVGSFLGPLIGGGLIAYGLNQGQMFLVAAVPAALACALVIAMAYNKPEV
ncbi:hypothetical protein BA177_04170 [Woeseia oceani]|uniref:Major facilitator superfamily (MFS) profile domain-containing protein n=1 Tax=Woeseia oceani TaxID=1548547 RepID=A0A193LKA0_9GAMM|nr:hypothetical protein BA177_04170 [Woeseia oceani]